MRLFPMIAALCSLLVACGGDQERTTTPDESTDLEIGGRQAAPMPVGLDGTRWRWVEAHCTEGPLDLSPRGYSATMRVHEQDGGLTLVADRRFEAEECVHTVVMRAAPPNGGADWHMEEVARVAVPASRECFGRPEDPRPGEVRRSGQLLEVLVQRSQWCNGLEVRMVYAEAPDELLDEDQIVRRYFAHFTRGDAELLARLFAETGSLLEPFTRTETGDPYRHDGRAAVERWHRETFQTAPWRAMRIGEISAGDQTEGGAAQRTVTWEYMDPRLQETLSGQTRFTIAAGEIFEAEIELTEEPRVRPDLETAEPDEEGSEQGEASEGEESSEAEQEQGGSDEAS